MLGDSLLVAPVFCLDTEETEFYLPKGTWTSFWDFTDVVVGPTWVKRRIPYDEIPVYVKEGSVLPLGPSGAGRPDYDFAANLDLCAYELVDGMSRLVEIPSGEGAQMVATLDVTNRGGQIVATLSSGALNGRRRVIQVHKGETSISTQH